MMDGISKETGRDRSYYIEKYKDFIWIPEETIEDFYEGSDGEPDWYHKGVAYSMAYADDGRDGWFVYARDFLDEEVPFEDEWDKVPKEFFPDLCTLVFNYKLLRDGRSIADYICDYHKTERCIVPFPPKFANNKERKK